MMKKIWFLLALLLCICAVSAAEMDEVVQCGDYAYRIVKGNKAEIVSYSGDAQHVVIPKKLDGHTVIGLGNNSLAGLGLVSVEIPGSVEYLGSYALADNAELTQVSMVYGLRMIGQSAFENTFSLTGIQLPGSLRYLGEHAFAYSGLETAVLPKGLKHVPDGLFWCCSSLRSVSIPDTVRTIGAYVFNECTSLERAVLPDSVVSIGDGLFHTCRALQEVTLSANLKAIPRLCFTYCTALKGVDIPHGVTFIGDTAFYACSFEELTLSAKVRQIDWMEGFDLKKLYVDPGFSAWDILYAYPDEAAYTDGRRIDVDAMLEEYSTRVAQTGSTDAYAYRILADGSAEITEYLGDDAVIEVPGKLDGHRVSSIASDAFLYKQIQRVVLPDSITRIGQGAFFGCDRLASIVLPTYLTSIEDSLFSGCTSLKKVIIPTSVASIGMDVFNGCESLESVAIPGSVKTLSFSAFSWCPLLSHIQLPSSIESIHSLPEGDSLSAKFHVKEGSYAEYYCLMHGMDMYY